MLNEAQPIVQQIFQQQHNCSALLDGASVFVVAPSMDLTPQVVQGLNGKITQFSFQSASIWIRTPPRPRAAKRG